MPAYRGSPRVVRANRRLPGEPDRPVAHHGSVFSPKQGEEIAYRGMLAYDFLILVSVDPRVVEIRQKASLTHWWTGQHWEPYRARYQLVLGQANSRTVRRVEIEVLPSHQLRAEAEKYRRITDAFRRDRRLFRVFDETKIRIEPRLTNAKIIDAQSGRGIVPDHDDLVVREMMLREKQFRVNDFVDSGILPYQRAYTACLNLVWLGVLYFRSNTLFDGNTVLRTR